MRRHIVSGEVLEKFNFGWDKIKKMPQAKVDKIPESKDEIDLKAEDHMPFLTLEQMKNRKHKQKKVNGEILCNNENFGGDPLVGK